MIFCFECLLSIDWVAILFNTAHVEKDIPVQPHSISLPFSLSPNQGHELHHNIAGGIILSDQSLVLQSVTKKFAGDYTCLAVNVEGRSESNAVTLRVRCECLKGTSDNRRTCRFDCSTRGLCL